MFNQIFRVRAKCMKIVNKKSTFPAKYEISATKVMITFHTPFSWSAQDVQMIYHYIT